MAKSDKLDDPTVTKSDRPAADAAPKVDIGVQWLDLFKLAFGATGDADSAVQQADRAQARLTERASRGA
jgi:hypothetical protein